MTRGVRSDCHERISHCNEARIRSASEYGCICPPCNVIGAARPTYATGGRDAPEARAPRTWKAYRWKAYRQMCVAAEGPAFADAPAVLIRHGGIAGCDPRFSNNPPSLGHADLTTLAVASPVWRGRCHFTERASGSEPYGHGMWRGVGRMIVTTSLIRIVICPSSLAWSTNRDACASWPPSPLRELGGDHAHH
jgi:hypothetical protein